MVRYFIFLLCVVCLTGQQAWSADREMFRVTNLHVDITADTAAAARTKALAQVQREAFNQLLSRIVLPEDQDKLNEVLGREGVTSDIQNYVRGLEISDEKTSTVRYIANVTVSFNQKAIEDLLTINNIRYGETTGQTLAVVPLFWDGQRYVLWDDENIWLDAWRSANVGNGLVPVIVPSESTELSVDEAVRKDTDALTSFATAQSANAALVVVAHWQQEALQLTIKQTVFNAGAEQRTTTTVVRGQPEQSTQEVMAEGVKRVYARLQNGWKHQTVRSPQLTYTEAKITFDSYGEWAAALRAVQAARGVDKVKTVRFNRSYAVVDIFHNLKDGALQTALREQKLSVQKGDPLELKMAGFRAVEDVIEVEEPVEGSTEDGAQVPNLPDALSSDTSEPQPEGE